MYHIAPLNHWTNVNFIASLQYCSNWPMYHCTIRLLYLCIIIFPYCINSNLSIADYLEKIFPPVLNCKTGNISADWIPPGSYSVNFATIKIICSNKNDKEMVRVLKSTVNHLTAHLSIC